MVRIFSLVDILRMQGLINNEWATLTSKQFLKQLMQTRTILQFPSFHKPDKLLFTAIGFLSVFNIQNQELAENDCREYFHSIIFLILRTYM